MLVAGLVMLAALVLSARAQAQPTPMFVVSANPTAGQPLSVATSGNSDFTTATLRVGYSVGPSCNDQGPIVVFGTHTLGLGPFSYTDSFTPASAGEYCIYALVNAAGKPGEPRATSVSNVARTVRVGPPPPPPGRRQGATTGTPRGSAGCVVPRLLRRSLASAKRRLAAGGCRLGSVRVNRFRPPRRLGQRLRLVVVSAHPAAGTRLPRGARIALVLALRPQPKPRPRSI